MCGWCIHFLKLLYYLYYIIIVDRVQVLLRTIVNKGHAPTFDDRDGVRKVTDFFKRLPLFSQSAFSALNLNFLHKSRISPNDIL